MKKLLIVLLLIGYTIAHAGSTTREIYIPTCGLPGVTQEYPGGSVGDSSVAGRMMCFPFVPCTGITNATQMKFVLGITNITNSTTHIGAAIYDASGNYKVRGTATYGNSAEDGTVAFSLSYPSGSSFTLVDGTKYFECYCTVETTGTGDSMTMAAAANSSHAPHFIAFMNAFSSNRWGTSDSGHYCDLANAMPPETMGSLTAQSTGFPLLFKLGTSAP